MLGFIPELWVMHDLQAGDCAGLPTPSDLGVTAEQEPCP